MNKSHNYIYDCRTLSHTDIYIYIYTIGFNIIIHYQYITYVKTTFLFTFNKIKLLAKRFINYTPQLYSNIYNIYNIFEYCKICFSSSAINICFTVFFNLKNFKLK